jgi:gamma-glutamyl-gamma-aminobutyrate hydrolase PuuD
LLGAVIDRHDVMIEPVDHRAVGYTGAGLQVVATAADGQVVAVEGLGDLRALGIEWHPERLVDQAGNAALFEWLVREAGETPTGPVPVVESGAFGPAAAVPSAIV